MCLPEQWGVIALQDREASEGERTWLVQQRQKCDAGGDLSAAGAVRATGGQRNASNPPVG